VHEQARSARRPFVRASEPTEVSFIMMQSIPRGALVETLLNTLEAERYVRGPLLATIVDELSAATGLEVAADAARAMLQALQAGHLGDSDFAARLQALRQLIHTLAAPPNSGERLITTGPLAGAAPRFERGRAASAA
jgi:hypothetical protein